MTVVSCRLAATAGLLSYFRGEGCGVVTWEGCNLRGGGGGGSGRWVGVRVK
jgi:hypothetical protein